MSILCQTAAPANSGLRTIPPSWPFAMWGLDSVGPFRTAQGGYKFILVAVNKFAKWIVKDRYGEPERGGVNGSR
jgi:hypothetical protein